MKFLIAFATVGLSTTLLFSSVSQADAAHCSAAFSSNDVAQSSQRETVGGNRLRESRVNRGVRYMLEKYRAWRADTVAQIRFYAKWRRKFREWNGDYESRAVAQQRRNLENLNWFLINGEKDPVVNRVSPLVDAVEASYEKAKYLDLAIKEISGRLEREQREPTEQEQQTIEEFENLRSISLQRFMSEIRDYQGVNSLISKTARSGRVQNTNENLGGGLESAIPESQTTERDAILANTARSVLNEMGKYKSTEEHRNFMNDVRQRAGIEVPSERPTQLAMNDFYRENAGTSAARLSRIKRELRSEIWTAIKRITRLPQGLQQIERVIARMPAPYKQIFSFLVSSGYDQQMRDRYFSEIQSILRMRDQGAGIDDLSKFDRLRHVDANTAGNEFLITFARTTHATRIWDSLKVKAQQLAEGEHPMSGDPAGSTIYRNFYSRMLSAEQTALRMGEISLYHDPSKTDQFARLLWTGATATAIAINPALAAFLNPAEYNFLTLGLASVGAGAYYKYRENRESARVDRELERRGRQSPETPETPTTAAAVPGI